MRPFIGLTCSAEADGRPVVRPPYVAAIHAAGGLPVPIPFLRDEGEAHELLARLDGIVLSGSEDLHPSLWGEALHPAVTLMHENRQRTELAVTRALLEGDLPLLAICGGMQTLTVAAGGRIHQHLPDLDGPPLLDHAVGVDGPRHAVQVVADSRLASCAGASFEVNTAHHQAVAALGAGQVAVAHSEDGVLEAYEMPARRFCVGVQWHPERMPSDAGQARLFAELVAAAR